MIRSFFGMALALGGFLAASALAPAPASAGPAGGAKGAASAVDRSDPDASAAAFGRAYAAKDLKAIGAFLPPRYQAQIDDLVENGEASAIYELLYRDPEAGWPLLLNWTGEAPPAARLAQAENERWYPLAAVGDEMFVLTLTSEGGNWYVADVHSPSLSDFEGAPFADATPD
ncbi:MAG: hypothetical protein AAF909_07305 [Pseudomonadota bacterium]